VQLQRLPPGFLRLMRVVDGTLPSRIVQAQSAPQDRLRQRLLCRIPVKKIPQ
jgi:hypothetical protein